MPRAIRGHRIPGSGKQPSAAALQLRELALDILRHEHSMSLYQLRQEVEKRNGPVGAPLKFAMLSLVNSGDVIYERRNLRYGEYYAADYMRKNKSLAESIEGKTMTPIDEIPYVRRVAADQLPKLAGPILAPMDWCLHYLLGGMMRHTRPHLYLVSKTQWACSPSVNDKHILRCIFGDTAKQAFQNFERNIQRSGENIRPCYAWMQRSRDIISYQQETT
jgi:hypothetical protein